MSDKKNRTKKKGGFRFISSIYKYLKNKNIQKINTKYYKEHQEKINTFKNIKISDVLEGDSCDTCTLYHFLKNEKDEYSNSIILRRSSNYYVLDTSLISRMEDYCDNNATRNIERPIYNLRKSHTELEGFFSNFEIENTLFSNLDFKKIPQYKKIFHVNTDRNELDRKSCRNHKVELNPSTGLLNNPKPSTFFKVEPLKIEDIEVERPNTPINRATVSNWEIGELPINSSNSISSAKKKEQRKVVNRRESQRRIRLADLDFFPEKKLSIIPESPPIGSTIPSLKSKSQDKSPSPLIGPTISNISTQTHKKRKIINRELKTPTHTKRNRKIINREETVKKTPANSNWEGPSMKSISTNKSRKRINRENNH